MPTYQITGPDGKKYRITGDNPEGAFAALQAHLGNQPAPEPDQRDNLMGKVDSIVRGAADTLSFGLADEIAAGGDALLNPIFGTGQAGESIVDRYNANLLAQRGTDESDADNRSGYRLAGQLAGGVAGGLGLAKNGMSLTANAVERGANLARVSAASAGEGMILGGLQGFGSGEGGIQDRVRDAAVSSLVGGGIGMVAPGAVAGVSKVAKGAVAPFAAPFMPEPYAREAVATALRRSGKTPGEIAGILRYAAEEGQPMYNVADAMGYTGQRLMSTVARNPSGARQMVAEALQRRQAGQGERLAQFVAEGLDAGDSAAQRQAGLTTARTETANRLYSAARRDAGAVNVSPVLETIDQTLSPGVNRLASPRDNIGYDTIEGALARVRRMISDGNSQVTDFDTLFRAKLDVDDMIQRAEAQGAGNRAHYLAQVQRQIDNALADASPSYAQARDTFARDSRRIEAVEAGRTAFRPSQRADDTVSTFSAMTPEEQAAFRAGYADPATARLEAASMSPTTNKARILQTPKYEEELRAFAAPDQADRLGRRIGREQRMFDTAAAALGGSKTADNLADAADMSKLDPGVMSALFRQDYIGALMNGLQKTMSTAKGTPPAVIERMAKTIMETNPDAALRILSKGSQRLTQADQMRARVAAALIASGAAGAGRL